MLQEIVQYMQAHPRLTVTLGVIVLLAIVGLWYVLAHHLEAILMTFLTVAGMASGAIVFYRGLEGGMQDLAWIGLFLMVVFPVVFYQAVKTQKSIVATSGAGGGKSKVSKVTA